MPYAPQIDRDFEKLFPTPISHLRLRETPSRLHIAGGRELVLLKSRNKMQHTRRHRARRAHFTHLQASVSIEVTGGNPHGYWVSSLTHFPHFVFDFLYIKKSGVYLIHF